MPCAITIFASLALKHLMHCIILILSHPSARPCAHRAEIGNSSGGTLKGVWWSTRDMCENTNIVVIKAIPSASHPILDFYIFS
jgi:hypothetical protein